MFSAHLLPTDSEKAGFAIDSEKRARPWPSGSGAAPRSAAR